MKYTDITSFENACQALGREAVLPEVSKLPPAIQKYLIAHTKLITIIEAMNFVEGNWKPDYTNWDEPKYYVWPEVAADKERPSGFGFSDSYFNFDFTCSGVGSRLCMKSAEMVLWALEQHKDLFIINQLLID